MRRSNLLFVLCMGLLFAPQLALAEGFNLNLKTGPQGAYVLPSNLPKTPIPFPRGSVSPLPSPPPMTVPVASPLPQKFCTNLTTLDSTIGDATTTRYGQLQSDLAKQGNQIVTNLTGIQKQLDTARGTADTQRKQNFASLTSMATTPAQKQAIATFETTVNQAITTERAAIDAADQAFTQGLLSAVSNGQSNLATASATYKTAVEAALAAAQASCQADANPSTVRQTLQTALQTARTNFQNALKNAMQNSPDVTALKTARATAVNAATATLKATVQQALTTLKAALGSGSPNPTVSPTP